MDKSIFLIMVGMNFWNPSKGFLEKLKHKSDFFYTVWREKMFFTKLHILETLHPA